MSNRIHKRALDERARAPTSQKHRQGGTMGIVMIRCPATGRDISTGIKVDRPRFECSPVFFAQTYCPFCRSEHQWFAKDAWVEDQPASAA
jgi:hypothetical protein